MLRSNYLLGFQPADPKADGRTHGIEVKVGRPGVQVIARKSYTTPRAPSR
jgi:hypothetical protein